MGQGVNYCLTQNTHMKGRKYKKMGYKLKLSKTKNNIKRLKLQLKIFRSIYAKFGR